MSFIYFEDIEDFQPQIKCYSILKKAYYSQKPNKQLVFHTDLGSQYTSNDMKILCSNLNITQSFSKKGCPYDNSCIESFHASLKKDEVYTK